MSLYDPPTEPHTWRLLDTPCTCGASELRHKDTCAKMLQWRKR
jgi:hypothetical protein